MTKEEKEEIDRAITSFRNFPQRAALMAELNKRLSNARKVHETVNDLQIPCQHRWAQGRVSGIAEIINLLEGDLR